MSSWAAASDEHGWRKGPWTPQEDKLLAEYVSQHGEGRWSYASKYASLNRSGKSCRLRWVNYLRPGLKKGHMTPQEEGIIIELHALWGNKWSTIARYLPGRTDNEIKNYWRTHFKKRIKVCGQKQQQAAGQSTAKADQQTSDGKHGMQETISDNPNMESNNNNPLLPVINYQDYESASWSSDFIPVDCYLWGGLWNLDDQNGGTKDQLNLANCSRGGDINTGGFIF